MRKPLLTLAGASLAAAVTLVSCAAPEPAPAESPAAATQVAVPAELAGSVAPADARVISDPAEAKATLVLFTDYQCPYCSLMDELIQQAKEDYGDSVRIVVRNYPLPMHQNAKAAAQAVEAAAEQGALEDMARTVFEHQKDWHDDTDAEEVFAGYAEDLGLDLEKFRADYSSQQIADRVDRDLRDAQALDLPGTPSLILDGQVLTVNPMDYATLQEPLENAIEN